VNFKRNIRRGNSKLRRGKGAFLGVVTKDSWSCSTEKETVSVGGGIRGERTL